MTKKEIKILKDLENYYYGEYEYATNNDNFDNQEHQRQYINFTRGQLTVIDTIFRELKLNTK